MTQTPTTSARPLLDPALQEYAVRHSTAEHPALRELAAATAERFAEQSRWLIGPDQGTFMTLLTRAIGARTALEIGTFTGYSALCIARGLTGDDARLVCCDISDRYAGLARAAWRAAGVDERIELRIGPAVETLRAMDAAPAFDLAFIDADKDGYIDYWEEVVPRTNPGGLILVDNTFAYGGVLEPREPAPGVLAPNPVRVHAFNEHAAADPRVELVMLPIRDGLTLARRH